MRAKPRLYCYWLFSLHASKLTKLLKGPYKTLTKPCLAHAAPSSQTLLSRDVQVVGYYWVMGYRCAGPFCLQLDVKLQTGRLMNPQTEGTPKAT